MQRDTNKLYVEVGAPTGAPVTGKLGDEASTTSTVTRGNQITIKFSNLLLAGDKTFVKDKSGKGHQGTLGYAKSYRMGCFLCAVSACHSLTLR